MTLAKVKGTRNAELLCNALFNVHSINAGRLAVSSDDTIFEYAIVTDDRLNKSRQRNAEQFIGGFLSALNCYDLVPR